MDPITELAEMQMNAMSVDALKSFINRRAADPEVKLSILQKDRDYQATLFTRYHSAVHTFLKDESISEEARQTLFTLLHGKRSSAYPELLKLRPWLESLKKTNVTRSPEDIAQAIKDYEFQPFSALSDLR